MSTLNLKMKAVLRKNSMDGIDPLKLGRPCNHQIYGHRFLRQLRGDRRSLPGSAFDLLCLDSEDLRQMPLIERQKRLARLVLAAKCPRLLYAQHVMPAREGLFRSSPTLSARSSVWLSELKSRRTSTPLFHTIEFA
jgi:hypothetical protein